MSDIKSPTIGPWVCPYCGTLGKHTHCDECYAVRPYQMPAHNSPSSYFRVIYGPIGLMGMPPFFSWALVAYIVGSTWIEATADNWSFYVGESNPVVALP